MNIQEMHSAFRILGQQAGMQLVRGILPTHIDICINAAIVEKTRQELLLSTRTVLQEQVNTHSSTMTSINLFRPLYKVARINVETLSSDDVYNESKNGYYIITLPTKANGNVTNNGGYVRINPMMYLGFSLEYDDESRGNPTNCRIIGSDVIETTIHDFCNGATKDTPIVSLSSIINSEENVENINKESYEQIEIFTNTKDCNIKFINIKYIKKPSVVKFDADLSKCVNCDLPDYCHYEIVEKAIQKYYASVSALINTRKQTE